MSQMFRNEIISSVSGTTILDEGPANFPAVSLTDDGEVIYYKNPGHKMRLWIDKESFEGKRELDYVSEIYTNSCIAARKYHLFRKAVYIDLIAMVLGAVLFMVA